MISKGLICLILKSLVRTKEIRDSHVRASFTQRLPCLMCWRRSSLSKLLLVYRTTALLSSGALSSQASSIVKLHRTPSSSDSQCVIAVPASLASHSVSSDSFSRQRINWLITTLPRLAEGVSTTIQPLAWSIHTLVCAVVTSAFGSSAISADSLISLSSLRPGLRPVCAVTISTASLTLALTADVGTTFLSVLSDRSFWLPLECTKTSS